jgi:hypothetical protein
MSTPALTMTRIMFRPARPKHFAFSRTFVDLPATIQNVWRSDFADSENVLGEGDGVRLPLSDSQNVLVRDVSDGGRAAIP